MDQKFQLGVRERRDIQAGSKDPVPNCWSEPYRNVELNVQDDPLYLQGIMSRSDGDWEFLYRCNATAMTRVKNGESDENTNDLRQAKAVLFCEERYAKRVRFKKNEAELLEVKTQVTKIKAAIMEEEKKEAAIEAEAVPAASSVPAALAVDDREVHYYHMYICGLVMSLVMSQAITLCGSCLSPT